MYYKVKIKSLPKAKVGYQIDGSLANDVSSFGDSNTNFKDHSNIKVTKSITAVPRKDANLEAEGGETVIGNIDGSKIPSFFNIEGPRHTKGGVPLNLPDDSFIFSDTKAMMITDPVLLKMFNMPIKKGGYTPAEMSKKFDINKYREILQDRNSDKIDINTAELMIKNYVIKLGALALAQESKKGFPQGIPKLSEPYMESNGISEEDLIPKKENLKGQQQSKNNNMPQEEEEVEEEEEVTEMPNGEPIAQPQEEMMRYGGMRRLRRAQEGMQQPSEEEMMMMQQQAQQQQQPQQGGQDQQMMQIMQQVEQALQQGAKPEELAVELLQNQIAPEEVAQIFVELGMPQDQVQQLVMSVVQQMQGRQQQDPRQQQMSEEEMMAMQQQDPSQMQQAPMAAYGMSMGGYDMPFYDDSYEMAYGGMPKYVTGGPGDTDPKKIKKSEYNSDKYKDYTEKDKVKTKTTYNEISGKKEYTSDRAPSGGGKNPNLVADLCRNMKQPGSRHYGKTAEEVVAYAGLNKSAIVTLKACEQKATIKSVDAVTYDEEETPPVKEETTTTENCQCTKKDGTKYSVNKNPYFDSTKPEGEGNMPCEECDEEDVKTPECQCEDESLEGYQPKDADGNCTCSPVKQPAQWWLQDNVNTMGAASDLASIKKYMPWEARVDLEEPRPTFLDPTRELAAQSEQANIASQASASFAGPQGLGARNAATQGNAATQAANTLGNINNQNVNIANQFEGTQTGIRNQESMLNQQMANRVYDKNTIANQNFDNAKLQGRQNLRNAYNTGVTNKWKTDALNQMYPNYQTRPGIGGRVEYTPTDKTLDTTKKQSAYANAKTECQDQGLTGGDLTKCIDSYMKYNSKYGGESFEYGGFVYTVYPNY